MATITIRMSAGTTTVDAMPCGVPGLVIHRVILADGEMGEGLTLTHVRSGLQVAYFPPGVDPEAVLACAQDLAGLADWTQPGAVLVDAKDAVIAITRRWGSEAAGPLAYTYGDVAAAGS